MQPRRERRTGRVGERASGGEACRQYQRGEQQRERYGAEAEPSQTPANQGYP